MDFLLDPRSPVPLYHQLVETIAYRIAVGRIRRGDLLPSLRHAADLAGIHYLTVRKAYAELERRGLVERRRGIGTRVVTPDGAGTPAAPIHAVECNRPQAADYAGQLAAALGTPVGTWLLDEGRPPPGLLVGTYFHFNDIRDRWPDRGRDLRFVAVRPDPDVADDVSAGENGGRPGRVVLCETDPVRAHNVLPDLTELLAPEQFEIESILARDPRDPLDREDDAPVLYSPRIWARLDEAARADPRAVLLRYRINPEDLAGLRGELSADAARAS